MILLSKEALILGSGGHAESVLGLVKASSSGLRPTAYISRRKETTGPFKHLTRIEWTEIASTDIVLLNGVGVSLAAEARWRLYSEGLEFGCSESNLVANSAVVDETATLGRGVQIFQMAIVQTGSSIGDGVVLGARSVVEHNSHISRGAFVAPGALILGGAFVDEFSIIHAGAIVLPGVRIGEGSILGAGSVALSDIPEGQVHVGNPAAYLKDVHT